MVCTYMNSFAAPFPRPEQRLLVYCARTELGSEQKAVIHDLLRQPIDWRYLLEIGQSHGVGSLLYHSLAIVEDSHTPTSVLDTLRLRFLANARRNVFFADALFHVMDLLHREGIPSVPIKGPILAAATYGNLSLRQFTDLDILVHRKDALRARDCLGTLGFLNNFGLHPQAEEALIRYQKDFQLVYPERGTIIELHWSLEPGRRFLRFSDEIIWQRLTTAQIEGRSVPNLSPEDSLLYLCLHGANHRWDRLSWICDVAETVARYPNLDWELVIDEACRLQCRRMLFLGLVVASSVLDAPMPRHIRSMALRFSGVAKIAGLVGDYLFSPPAHLSVLHRNFSFHLMVRDSWHSRLELCLRRAFVPDALDFRCIRLPPAWYFLLPLIRPFRLMAVHMPAHLVTGIFTRKR